MLYGKEKYKYNTKLQCHIYFVKGSTTFTYPCKYSVTMRGGKIKVIYRSPKFFLEHPWDSDLLINLHTGCPILTLKEMMRFRQVTPEGTALACRIISS